MEQGDNCSPPLGGGTERTISTTVENDVSASLCLVHGGGGGKKLARVYNVSPHSIVDVVWLFEGRYSGFVRRIKKGEEVSWLWTNEEVTRRRRSPIF